MGLVFLKEARIAEEYLHGVIINETVAFPLLCHATTLADVLQ